MFTRYPQPGTTKTRLISALGATGAATLQQQMTEHTLAQARAIAPSLSLSVEVRYTGGSLAQMERWLGTNWQYSIQGQGDLGDRLTQAVEAAFTQGAQHVVVIGIDCPDLDAAGLADAFERLQTHDLVLGPATDGGYYLIGLSRPVPELFAGIDWSTERVLAQTVAIAQQHKLAIAQLPILPDVDYPDDLPVWQRVSQRPLPATTETISIIIPVVNEAPHIQAVLPSVLAQTQAANGAEVIVVDGGSRDNTVELATSLGATVVTAPPGRATQMNRGAEAATGDILLFLHADTRLPDQAITKVRQTLVAPDVVAGAFELNIQGDQPGLRLVEKGVAWRSRLLQFPYGDQALFLHAKTFKALGGFPEIPLMEDFELVRQLRTLGAIAIVPAAVTTSGRRWQRLGVLRTTLLNQMIIAGYLLGVPPKRLARWYRRDRTPPAQASDLENA